MKSDFMDMKDILKLNPFASFAEDGLKTSDITTYLDTGSYIVNALLSGSIYGGIPGNKITSFAGESSVGKTFFALAIVDTFLKDNPDGVVVYFDSEAAITKQLLVNRGIDVSRVLVMPVATVEEFRHQALVITKNHRNTPEESRRPMLMVLDSLGNLSTSKEIGDIAAGKETRDMTRSQLIKAAFRALTIELSVAGVPLIVTNHTYKTMELYSQEVASGGSGLQYTGSTIVFLSKKKDRDKDNKVVGNIIHVKQFKSRITKENQMVDTRLSYETGLDRYYGLVDLAIGSGIWKKISTRIELQDGRKLFQSQIEADPEAYFTEEVLAACDEFAGRLFRYGSDIDETETLESIVGSSTETVDEDGEDE